MYKIGDYFEINSFSNILNLPIKENLIPVIVEEKNREN